MRQFESLVTEVSYNLNTKTYDPAYEIAASSKGEVSELFSLTGLCAQEFASSSLTQRKRRRKVGETKRLCFCSLFGHWTQKHGVPKENISCIDFAPCFCLCKKNTFLSCLEKILPHFFVENIFETGILAMESAAKLELLRGVKISFIDSLDPNSH